LLNIFHSRYLAVPLWMSIAWSLGNGEHQGPLFLFD
jgi:hypothetical protein